MTNSENVSANKMASSAVITASARNHLSPTLPFCNYLSPPMVTKYNKKLCVLFLIGRGEVINPELGYQLWPPSLLAAFDAKSGSFLEIRSVRPADFSRKEDETAPMGLGMSLSQKNEPVYLGKLMKLFDACDQFLDAIASESPSINAASSFQTALKNVVEPTLWNYCELLLHHFKP